MIDTAQAKQIDLLSIVEKAVSLKKAGSREWSGPCPSCGGKNRFSVRVMDDGNQAWICRGCSDGKYHDTIDYARHFNGMNFQSAVEWLTGRVAEIAPIRRKIAIEPRKRPYWYHKNQEWFTAQFGRNLHRWHEYKNVNVDGFGVGVLPMSKCRHERLIVPVYDDVGLVCLRGRQINCDCDGKWLASGGFQLDDLPLYNADKLTGTAVVVLVENPIDAVMIDGNVFDLLKPTYGELVDMQNCIDSGVAPIAGVACYSTSYWRDSWTKALWGHRVIVALDNDLPGNGGAASRKQLLAERNGKPMPKAAGVKIVNELIKGRVNARLLDWGNAPVRMDVGEWMGKT